MVMLQMSRYVCVCLLAVFILHVIFPALKKKKKKDSSPEKGYPGQIEYSMKLDFFQWLVRSNQGTYMLYM